MNLPNLPTDNLYKFMALGGVVLIIFFITAWLTITLKINTMTFKFHQELQEINTEIIFLKSIQNITTGRIKYLSNQSALTNKMRENIYDLKIKSFEQLRNIKNKIEKNIILSEEKKMYEKRLKQFTKIAIICTLFSIFLSSLGFYFWYQRVQKYLDINIQKGRQENNE